MEKHKSSPPPNPLSSEAGLPEVARAQREGTEASEIETKRTRSFSVTAVSIRDWVRETAWLVRLVALAYSTLLTVMLLQSSSHPVVGPAAPPGEPDFGRELLLTSGHLVGFSVLTALWWAVFQFGMSRRRALVLAIMVALVLGAVTEVAQGLVPDRSVSAFALLSNAVAALAAAWVIERKVMRAED